ncbi:MAG TPA: TonB-dependent receptor [Chitinophagales bacterium]|nr:TonB-dependent receptor [Chitinophagales bacterium]
MFKRLPHLIAVTWYAFLLFGLLYSSLQLFAQSQSTISGTITDRSTGAPLPGATLVQTTNRAKGAVADVNGNFALPITENLPVMVEVSFLGYETLQLKIDSWQPVTIGLEPASVIIGKDVVITGSRISETILESPVSIQKVTLKDIKSSPSGDFYQGLGNLSGVDVVTASLGMKVINMRGFNTTAPVRMVQFIDGMDNQAPGLNFPVGNLVGAPDIDLQSVELISGAASAMYGANAFQGVVSMITRDPYTSPGLTVALKGGNRNYADAQVRYAQAFGKKQKLALKLTGAFSRIDDWEAKDVTANTYGDISTEQNLASISRQLQYSDDPEVAETFTAINGWLDFNPKANPPRLLIEAPGYLETDLSDNLAQSLKLGAGLYYKFNNHLRASYLYKYGRGTAVYQGSNRYSINDITFQQHKFELQGKRLLLKAYTTQEDAGKSYDMVFTGINIARASIVDNFIPTYLETYFNTLRNLTNDFDNSVQDWQVDQARNAAFDAAHATWYQPGTAAFDSLFNKITADPDLNSGSRFQDKSWLAHAEAQYNFNWEFADVLAGAFTRRYDPQSFGTIFSDTLIAETGQYRDIALWEYGGFLQVSKKLLNDKLKLIGSLRADKNQNFDLQWSPRLSAIYTQGNHHFRASAQSAFRSPTLQNQYIYLNLGAIVLEGNLHGQTNAYSSESVKTFLDHYQQTYEIDPSLLQAVQLNPLRPEQVRTLELGYRTIVNNALYVDATAYYSAYRDFIGDYRFYKPNGDAIAGQDSGIDAILTGAYTLMQTPVNSKERVNSYGATLGLAYYFGKGYTATANYTYAAIDTAQVKDPLIAGFNTPAHKINIGLQATDVWKKLGFAVNGKWVDGVYWESPFGNGNLDPYFLLDAQLSYHFPKQYSTIRIGGSNLLNSKIQQAFGAPVLGTTFYVGYTFEINKL